VLYKVNKHIYNLYCARVH